MYKAIVYFTDAQDNGYQYNVGDTFPRVGLVVTPERTRELLSGDNKRGVPVIEEAYDLDIKASLSAEETAEQSKDSIDKLKDSLEDKPKRTRKRKTDVE